MSHKNNATRKSRNFKGIVIEPFKQIRLGIYMLAISLTFVVLTSVLVFHAFVQQYQQVMSIFGVIDPINQRELVMNDIFYRNAYQIAGFFFFFIGLLFYVVFKATHRFFGPLVSIERFVTDIIAGDYSQRVVIRRGDELQGLAMKLNQMADALQQRHGARVGALPERRKTTGPDGREAS